MLLAVPEVVFQGIAFDLERLVAVGQGHAVGPAILGVFPAVGFAFESQLQGVPLALGFQRLHPVIQRGMGRGLAGEQKMKPVQQHLPAEGLMRVKIIAQQGVVAGGVTRGMSGQPASGGCDCPRGCARPGRASGRCCVLAIFPCSAENSGTKVTG